MVIDSRIFTANHVVAKGEIVDYFVTTDRELLDRRMAISELMGGLHHEADWS